MYAYDDFVVDLYNTEFANAIGAVSELLETLNSIASERKDKTTGISKKAMKTLASDYRVVRGIFNRLLLCHDWVCAKQDEESCKAEFKRLADNFIQIQ